MLTFKLIYCYKGHGEVLSKYFAKIDFEMILIIFHRVLVQQKKTSNLPFKRKHKNKTVLTDFNQTNYFALAALGSYLSLAEPVL